MLYQIGIVSFLVVIVLLASTTPLRLITSEDAIAYFALRLLKESQVLKHMAR